MELRLKTLTVAFQMNNIHHLNLSSDSTFLLIEEAIKLGFKVYYYQPNYLSLQHNRVVAVGQQITTACANKNILKVEDEVENLDLADMDIIWVRQDPPFNMSYLTSTYLLDYLKSYHSNIYIVNDTEQIRNHPEKIAIHLFPQYMPKTLITRYRPLIMQFLAEYRKVVIKPLYDAKGNGVFLLEYNHPNTEALINYFLTTYQEPCIIQQFLPKVSEGDKRVFVIDGEPAGAINRVPKTGEIISNLAQGGKAVSTELTATEYTMCKEVGNYLQSKNILFAGLDLIDNHITEINITSPTGLRVFHNFTGINLATTIWQKLLQKFW